jgi:diguanylate cyclase (GGDEF)-like protein/PAS domain S-box-containing protein
VVGKLRKRAWWGVLCRVALDGLEAVVALVFLLSFRPFGLVAGSPWWLFAVGLAGFGLLQQPGVERWLSGADPRGRLWLRAGLAVGTASVVAGAAGWAPFLPMVCLGGLSRSLRMTGADSWRPMAVQGSVATAGLYLATAIGWLPAVLTGRQALVVWTIVAACAVLIGRQLVRGAHQRDLAEAGQQRSEERFRVLARVQGPTDMITVADEFGRLSYVDPSEQRPVGLIGSDYTDTVHPDDQDRARAAFSAVLADNTALPQVELRLRYVDGTWHSHEVLMRNLLPDPDVRGVVFNHRDVTEHRAYEKRLAYDASHDTLTGLANRVTFLHSLEHAMAAAGQHHRRCAVLVLDLHEFSRVKDTLGSETGDGLLVAFGRLLQRSVFGADTVARLGTDELAIVLATIDAPEDAHAVANRIVAALTEPLDAAGQPVHAQVCIGVAVSGPDCTEPATLLRHADLAKRDAKRQRIDGWRPYTDALRTDHGDTVATAEELRTAIATGQLVLQYQPIVALDTGELRGVEALVRWQHPTLGYLGPNAFIPLAEASGFIVALGEWVLEQACTQVRRWHDQTPAGGRLYLSVNLSPRQLEQHHLPAKVRDILTRTGFDPSHLVLEVTENALVNDTSASAILAELNGHGIRIALDDFGTGYSSLRYLTNLPVDILKIDRCFVAELDGTPKGSAVPQAVIRLGHALNLDIIAEGIETAAQAQELTLLGCPLAQGYHYAKPLDSHHITQLLDNTPNSLPAFTPLSATTFRMPTEKRFNGD